MSSQKCVEPDFALENQRFENSAAQMGLSLEKLPGGFYVSAPTQKAWVSWVRSAAARLNSDKSRMEFENSPQFRGMDFTRSSSHPDYYESPYANGAWNGWKASRESLVIELPPAPSVPEDPEEAIDDSHMDGYNAAVRMRSACEKSIKAAGVKVKP